MCLYLDDLHSSVNQYFLKDQCMMLQNYGWVKDPFTVQNRPIEVIGMVQKVH